MPISHANSRDRTLTFCIGSRMRDVASLKHALAQIDTDISEIFVALPQLGNDKRETNDGALLHVARVRLSELEARRAIVLGALEKVRSSARTD